MAQDIFPSPPEGPFPTASTRPVPFEDREAIPGFWRRLGETFRLAFTDPLAFYERIPATRSFTAPWRLLMLFSVPLYLFLLMYAVLGGVMAIASAFAPKAEDRIIGLIIGGSMAGLVLFMPLLQFLGMLVAGTLNHAFLWMWGALKESPHGLPQTIRATAYTQAFIGLLSLIPLLGILAGLGGWILLGMGLARLHRTERWRGLCALATPLVLCGFVLVAGIGTVVALAIRQERLQQEILSRTPRTPPPQGPATRLGSQ